MDHFESVIVEYLRADRSLFVNTQLCIQLNAGPNPDVSGPHWYCDAVAVSLKNQSAYLCEITYANPPASLFKRLTGWDSQWTALRAALERDSGVPSSWSLRPWVFVPDALAARVDGFIDSLSLSEMPRPRVTRIEQVMPWLYRSWDRVESADNQ
ncbi:hypothetical protein [Dyella japonica]|uniref:Uncharacterized protein n=1 Tax=Dyella japonica A8 TaxID=1217721 RepID=A0A075JX59_9GAMM|nr:hypothetical protein [Dyella japonica]AIF46125.1 hypothetical protein HY57_02075 [Dyella japonica A8]